MFYNSDNSNAVEIAEKMKKPLKFNFKKIEDGYNELLNKTKSYYEEEKKMRFKVQATNKYERTNTNDVELTATYGTRYVPKEGEQWEVAFERKEKLVELGFVTVVEEIKEKPIKETIVEINEEDIIPKEEAEKLKDDEVKDVEAEKVVVKKTTRKKK